MTRGRQISAWAADRLALPRFAGFRFFARLKRRDIHGRNRMTQDLRLAVAAELERTRRRSAVLTDAVDDADLVRQHSPLMSPLVWDLAHVGNQEELWLVRDVGGREPVREDIDHLYDAFKQPRRDRPRLPLLAPAEARTYLHTVRDKVFDLLDRVPLEGRPL